MKHWYMPKQWIALKASSDWLRKLRISFSSLLLATHTKFASGKGFNFCKVKIIFLCYINCVSVLVYSETTIDLLFCKYM